MDWGDQGSGGTWTIRECLISDSDAARLIEEVQQEYVARYGSRDETPIPDGYFEPPHGAFFVGYLDEVPVATGGWHRRTDITVFERTATAEIKRMYVVPTARGAGWARRMLAHLEGTAAATGAEAMILETGSEQPEALALYGSAGYQPIPGFGLYRDSPLNRCLGRLIS